MKKLPGILLLFCLACSTKPKAPEIKISLTDSSRSIKINGVDNSIAGEISRDSTSGIWQNLIPVYKMPADTDLKSYQPVQPGNYKVKDNAIVFTPDTPFVKGRAYFIRYYLFKGKDAWDIVRDKRRLGEASYTDMVIKID